MGFIAVRVSGFRTLGVPFSGPRGRYFRWVSQLGFPAGAAWTDAQDQASLPQHST